MSASWLPCALHGSRKRALIGKKEDDLVLKLLSYPVHPELMIPHGDDHGCESWSDLAIVLKVGKHDLLPISFNCSSRSLSAFHASPGSKSKQGKTFQIFLSEKKKQAAWYHKVQIHLRYVLHILEIFQHHKWG